MAVNLVYGFLEQPVVKEYLKTGYKAIKRHSRGLFNQTNATPWDTRQI